MVKLLPWLLVSGVVCGAACTKVNPLVCCTSTDDCKSIGLDSTASKGCDNGLVCVDHGCTMAACSSDQDCSGATPHCSPDRVCVGCVDSTQCGGATPVCAPDSTCVGCLDSTQCSNPNPVCDTSSRTCKGCVVDDDCASKVCDVDNGMCIDPASILYASPTGPDTSNCALATPCSLTHAVSLADATKNTVRALPGTYTAMLTITGKAMTIVGTGATLMPTTNTGFQVDGGANVAIRGLDVKATNATQAVACLSTSGTTSLSLRELAVHSLGVAGSAISTNSCHLTMTQVVAGDLALGDSSLIANRAYMGSVTVSTQTGGSTSIQITNSVLTSVSYSNAHGGMIHVAYSTFTDAEFCDTPVGTRPTVALDNNIYTCSACSDSISGACTVSYSVAFPQTTSVGSFMTRMDPKFVDPAQGNYHLQAGSPAIDAANPSAPDPVDYDGTARPQGPANDIGAFEFH